MLFKLMIPENFAIKFPNYVKQNFIPTYHERVYLPKDGIIITHDERTKVALEKLGLQCIFASGLPARPVPPEEETWEEEPGDTIMLEDIDETGEPNLDYCKYCGKGFDVVSKEHVEGEHDLEWEEYERLPEMVPPLAMKIYWASKELQEAFEQPLNLLCGSGVFVNFLDWVKMEGTKRFKKLAEYYNVPFIPTIKKKFIPEPAERDFEEYCKICGAKAISIESHVVGHGIPMTEYNKLGRNVNDTLMDFFYQHKDLQKAFSNPMSLTCKHGQFSSYLSWCKEQGVKTWPIIRSLFKGKQENDF